MVDGDAEHEGAASSVLGDLTGGVGVAFHEGDDSGGGQRGVFDGGAFGADVGEVVPDTSAAFHELHLFLVDFHDAPVGVGGTFVADDKTVGEGGNLEVVPDAGHGSSLGDDVFEILEDFKDGVFGEGIGVALFDAGDFTRQAAVHVVGVLFEQVAVGILQRVLGHPYTGGEFVSLEVVEGAFESLFLGVGLFCCFYMFIHSALY